MDSKMSRASIIKPKTTVSIMGDDGPHPWHGSYCVEGLLLNYIVLEHYLMPWTRQGTSKTWDVAVIVKLSKPIKVSNESVIDPHSKYAKHEYYNLSYTLLVQRYPNLAWDDDCVVFVFGIPEISSIKNKSNLMYSVWKENVISLTTHSILKVGKCK